MRAHADAILAWAAGRDLAAVQAGFPAAASVLLGHAAALADAADSDDAARAREGLGALFGGLVEPLNDGFTPAGRWLYHRLFGHIVWRVAARTPELRARLGAHGIADEAGLLARHERLRRAPAPAPAQAARIVVLSRVTLGADVALTSVLLQRLRRRWPEAELVVLGDGKLAGLIGGMPGVRVRRLDYVRRGALRQRLASWLALDDAVADEHPDLVVAPDSRLDQLGLLPVGAEARYRLWENLQAEGAAVRSLVDLLDAWCSAWLGAGPPCVPRLAFDAERAALALRFGAAFGTAPLCAVKLDHGGNPAKALPRDGELHLLRGLRAKGWRVLLDRGFGPDELASSDALVDALGWRVIDLDDSGGGLGRAVAGLAADELAAAEVLRFHGSIGGWAAALSACRHAIAYDSVGHHLAAALGVGVTIAFTGWSDPGFPIAWQPRGPGRVALVAIPTAAKAEPSQWAAVLAAVPAAG